MVAEVLVINPFEFDSFAHSEWLAEHRPNPHFLMVNLLRSAIHWKCMYIQKKANFDVSATSLKALVACGIFSYDYFS